MRSWCLAAAVLMVVAVAGFAAAPVRNAGSNYFDSADKSLNDGAVSSASVLAEKGWAAVRVAGPADPGFLNGVYSASRIFAVLERELRAEAVYTEAEALCSTPGVKMVGLRVQFMHGFDLIRSSRYVKAESVLRAAFATENATERKTSLHVALLQSLAFVREQEGDLDDAEVLYRMTIGFPPPDLSEVVIERTVVGKQRLPFLGEPRGSLAAFYTNHGRFKEAEALYRAQLAQDASNVERRLAAMKQLAGFLRWHGSKDDAIAIWQQIIRLTESEALTDPKYDNLVARERYTLANLEVDAGRGDDAKALLELEVKQAEVQRGKSSREYQQALLDLFENRRYAGDYDAAGDLASELLRQTQDNGVSDPSERAGALFRLAGVRREQGKVVEAEALTKRGIEINRKAFPIAAQESEDQFEEAEALVRMGKHDDAVRLAREIADGSPHHDGADQFRFQHLAQLMAIDDTANAVKVASIALSSAERCLGDSPRLANHLTDWANFYRGMLRQPDRARDLLARAETVVSACCGVVSRYMEPVLQERAWLAPELDGKGSGMLYIEQLRDLRASIYGDNSQQVEQTTIDLAAAHAQSADWQGAEKLYFKAVDISSRRTGAYGYAYVSLLDSVATEFFQHGDKGTARTLNQRAVAHASDFVRSDELMAVLLQHRQDIESRR